MESEILNTQPPLVRTSSLQKPDEILDYMNAALDSGRKVIWIPTDMAMQGFEDTFMQTYYIWQNIQVQEKAGLHNFSFFDVYLIALYNADRKTKILEVRDFIDRDTGEVTKAPHPTINVENFKAAQNFYKSAIKRVQSAEPKKYFEETLLRVYKLSNRLKNIDSADREFIEVVPNKFDDTEREFSEFSLEYLRNANAIFDGFIDSKKIDDIDFVDGLNCYITANTVYTRFYYYQFTKIKEFINELHQRFENHEYIVSGDLGDVFTLDNFFNKSDLLAENQEESLAFDIGIYELMQTLIDNPDIEDRELSETVSDIVWMRRAIESYLYSIILNTHKLLTKKERIYVARKIVQSLSDNDILKTGKYFESLKKVNKYRLILAIQNAAVSSKLPYDITKSEVIDFWLNTES